MFALFKYVHIFFQEKFLEWIFAVFPGCNEFFSDFYKQYLWFSYTIRSGVITKEKKRGRKDKLMIRKKLIKTFMVDIVNHMFFGCFVFVRNSSQYFFRFVVNRGKENSVQKKLMKSSNQMCCCCCCRRRKIFSQSHQIFFRLHESI